MEKKFLNFSLIILLLFCALPVNSEEQIIVKPISSVNTVTQTISVPQTTTSPQNVSPTVPQVISFDKCTKKYMVNVEKLYFLTLASINANKFVITEIQSKHGLILFKAVNRPFIASVSRVDSNSAILKILPADNNYYFPLGVLTNIFKYIDLNINAEIESLG